MECEQYCWRHENRQECDEFGSQNGFEMNCHDQYCKECSTCRFESGEMQCQLNQQFNAEMGFCDCIEGFNDCDGDWENGCESSSECGMCQTKSDCAADRCSEWGNVIQQFDCVKGETWVEERGMFRFGGTCSSSPTGRSEGYVRFDYWGEPFEQLEPIRREIEMGESDEWCKWELEELKRERKEIEESFNDEFLRWFFEEYVPSDPDEWEKHIGGIFDSYWRIVDNSRRIAELMPCVGGSWPEEYTPISANYNTEYGNVELWETLTTTDMFGSPTQILSPYMKVWVFPTRDFMKKEMQKSMEEGVMPGPEGKRSEPTPADIEKMKSDPELMAKIRSISDKYGGDATFLMTVKDGEEMVFRTVLNINPDTLFSAKPVKEYTGEVDVSVNMAFSFLYDMIKFSESEMRGGHIERPPWDQGWDIGESIDGMVDGVSMWWMVNSAVMSGQITAEPSSGMDDAMAMMEFMFGGPEKKRENPEGIEQQPQATAPQ
jgi:hypothetical protein